jgi:hypothetical protein
MILSILYKYNLVSECMISFLPVVDTHSLLILKKIKRYDRATDKVARDC